MKPKVRRVGLILTAALAALLVLAVSLLRGEPLGGPSPAEAVGMWSPTGNMAEARRSHTSTMVAGGRVLVVGGITTGDAYLPSAELYNPATGTWSGAGTMTYGRSHHTATGLPNGKILVAGGFGPGALGTSELLDLSGGGGTAGGNLVTPRRQHKAAALTTGKVLIAGGGGGDATPLASAELYDPVTNAFTTTGSMATGRNEHALTVLANGKVLAVGGVVSTAPISATGTLTSSAELYDPFTGIWSTAGNISAPRRQHAAITLLDGRALVTGGVNAVGLGVPQSSADLYDPITNSWSPAASMAFARTHHTATLLGDGKVMVVGGYAAMAEIYDPATNTWTPAGSLITNRAQHTANLLLNDRLLVAGGLDTTETVLASAELYSNGRITPRLLLPFIAR
jgi:N-acetylneuraminic acid mutarotase